MVGRKTCSHETAADGEEEETDEAENAESPGPANLGNEILHHERKDNATNGTAGCANACGKAAACLEPVAYGGNGW